MTTIPVVENRWTPLPDVDPSAFYSLPPEATLRWSRDQMEIRVEGRAGSIPLVDGRAILVLPKVGKRIFHHMAAVARGDRTSPEDALREFGSYGFSDEGGIPANASRRLLDLASLALTSGPLLVRSRHATRSDFVQGRVDLAATELGLRMRSRRPVVTEVSRRESNTPENRVVATALGCLDEAWLAREGGAGFAAVRRWTDLATVASQRDLEDVSDRLLADSYRGTRDYYAELLRVALIALDFAGYSFDEQSAVHGEAHLVNTATVFEEWVRTLVTRGALARGAQVAKVPPGAMHLYKDGSCGLEPDMLVSRSGRHLFLGDAKYKDPTSGDHYQMVTYLSSYKLSTGVLVAASADSVEREVAHRTPSGLDVVELHLPLSNWKRTEELLLGFVENYTP